MYPVIKSFCILLQIVNMYWYHKVMFHKYMTRFTAAACLFFTETFDNLLDICFVNIKNKLNVLVAILLIWFLITTAVLVSLQQVQRIGTDYMYASKSAMYVKRKNICYICRPWTNLIDSQKHAMKQNASNVSCQGDVGTNRKLNLIHKRVISWKFL